MRNVFKQNLLLSHLSKSFFVVETNLTNVACHVCREFFSGKMDSPIQIATTIRMGLSIICFKGS